MKKKSLIPQYLLDELSNLVQKKEVVHIFPNVRRQSDFDFNK